MRFTAQILSAILLAGMAAAQSAPASQTVQQPAPPAKSQSGMDAVKKVLKNPFRPKDKPAASAPAQQGPAKPQAPNTQAAVPAAKSNTAAKSSTPVANAKVAAKVAPAAKPANPVAKQTKPASAAKQPAPVKVKAKVQTAPPAKPVAHAAVKMPTKPATEPVAPAKAAPAAPAVAQSTAPKLPSPGKRDPFLSPIAAAAMRGPAANCSTGKHCLVVEQIALKGIVQTNSGNIAMVENASKRSYYLHENDALFDGSVVKITGDSVTFRQESSDILGRPVSKEVVKKVSAPAV